MEATLVERVVQGDADAWKEFVLRTGNLLYALLWPRANGDHNLCAELFLHVLEGLRQDDPDKEPFNRLRGYLEIAARRGGKVRLATWLGRVVQELATSFLDNRGPAGSTQGGRFATTPAGGVLRAALKAQPAESRLVLACRLRHGLSVASIARLVGRREDWVAAELIRLRDQLQHALAEAGIEPERLEDGLEDLLGGRHLHQAKSK